MVQKIGTAPDVFRALAREIQSELPTGCTAEFSTREQIGRGYLAWCVGVSTYIRNHRQGKLCVTQETLQTTEGAPSLGVFKTEQLGGAGEGLDEIVETVKGRIEQVLERFEVDGPDNTCIRPRHQLTEPSLLRRVSELLPNQIVTMGREGLEVLVSHPNEVGGLHIFAKGARALGVANYVKVPNAGDAMSAQETRRMCEHMRQWADRLDLVERTLNGQGSDMRDGLRI